MKFALGGIGAGLLVAGLALGAAFAFGVFGETPGASGETTGGPGPEPVVAVAGEQASGTDATEATNETARQGASVEPNTAPPPTGVAPPVPAEEARPPLLLHSDPPGATVRRNGEDLGDTPLPLVIPRGDRWTISVSLTGYMTRVVQVAAGQPTLTLQLDPMAEPSAAPPSTPPSTRAASPPSTGRRGRSAGTGRGRSRGGAYTPDLNDPWATRR